MSAFIRLALMRSTCLVIWSNYCCSCPRLARFYLTSNRVLFISLRPSFASFSFPLSTYWVSLKLSIVVFRHCSAWFLDSVMAQTSDSSWKTYTVCLFKILINILMAVGSSWSFKRVSKSTFLLLTIKSDDLRTSWISSSCSRYLPLMFSSIRSRTYFETVSFEGFSGESLISWSADFVKRPTSFSRIS